VTALANDHHFGVVRANRSAARPSKKRFLVKYNFSRGCTREIVSRRSRLPVPKQFLPMHVPNVLRNGAQLLTTTTGGGGGYPRSPQQDHLYVDRSVPSLGRERLVTSSALSLATPRLRCVIIVCACCALLRSNSVGEFETARLGGRCSCGRANAAGVAKLIYGSPTHRPIPNEGPVDQER
jgi:hypothetical protein